MRPTIKASGVSVSVSCFPARLRFVARLRSSRNPGFRAISVSGRLGAGYETGPPPALGSPPPVAEEGGNVNSKCPSLSVKVAKRLSGENTSARSIGSCVRLFTTVPRMLSVSAFSVCRPCPTACLTVRKQQESATTKPNPLRHRLYIRLLFGKPSLRTKQSYCGRRPGEYTTESG